MLPLIRGGLTAIVAVDGAEARVLSIGNVFWSKPLSREESRWYIVTLGRWEGLGGMPMDMSSAVARHQGSGNRVHG